MQKQEVHFKGPTTSKVTGVNAWVGFQGVANN
jgi:hypothetical protein